MTTKPIRVCLIATELKGFGPYGGFGVLTYDIATGLAKKGLDVFVAMPRKEGQAPVERIGNVNVISYPLPSCNEPNVLYAGLKFVLPFAGVYRMIDADIYHSQEASLGTALAQIASPDKKHFVSFIDPRNFHDWTIEWAHRNLNKFEILKYYIKYQWETGGAARRANGNYCHTKHIIDKAKQIFWLAEKPGFLPSPTRMLEISAAKAAAPTVCYLGRWDERKRPELFFELAVKFPDVKFVAVGACLNDAVRDKALRQHYLRLKNVEAPGWLAEKESASILDRAWIIINTSTREGLPVTYLEAGAHKCAILSHCNTDDFASNFGFWAQKGDLADYEKGLKFLLSNNQWKDLGEKAYNYVLNTHEYNRVIDQHIAIYERALAR